MPEDREELQKLTVVQLRELARKRLGRGISKLRTKAQLVEALSSRKVDAADRKGAKAAAPPAKKPRRMNALKSATAGPTRASKRAATKSAAAPDVRGDVPASEPLLALPLDAQTLLVRWKAVPVRGKGERWEVEVSSDGHPARTVRVAPEARRAYVRALDSGPVYRAKLVARDRNGRSRVIAGLSRSVVFFPQPAPPPSRERFVHYSWSDGTTSALGDDQPVPQGRLPSQGELATQGTEAAAWSGAATSPTGSVAGAPLGWLLGSRLPTSFSN
jgi:hypothetical protein